ncbi:MAG: type I-E CRISPR-associated protein Cas7/Cse4/CasC [Phycisphaerae bacterium]|nr:type I-E CRISPR-associated protein Cas7/Cse4/CasC [Phycisphaerae bacterium]
MRNSVGRKLRVEAALQAAHAISTHAVVNEVDYFTAAEDLPYTQGAAHPDEAMYNAACFYKYFSLDWDQLVKNLAGPEPDKEKDRQAHEKWIKEVQTPATRLAAATLGHFILAAAKTTPSGKQNSFASNCEPCGILIEIKKDGKTPTSYANAFADPVERIGKWDDDGPDYVSLEGRSIARFGDHVFNLRKAYGIDSTLLWHAMPMYRFPLQGWEREDDGRKKRDKEGKELPPKPFKEWDEKPSSGAKPREHRSCARIDGDNKEGLVEAVIEELGLGFKWSHVMDAGRKRAKEAAPATVEG